MTKAATPAAEKPVSKAPPPAAKPAKEPFPWGDTPESAIRWSFNKLAHSSQPNSSLASMTRVDRGGKIDWSKLDTLAQASLLRVAVSRVQDPVLRAYIEAHYLPAPARQRVPGGGGAIFDRFGIVRGRAIQSVAHYLKGMDNRVGQATTLVGFEELVSQYVLGAPNNDTLCKAMRLRRERAAQVRAMWYEKLDEIHAQAMQAVAAQLRRVGLL